MKTRTLGTLLLTLLMVAVMSGTALAADQNTKTHYYDSDSNGVVDDAVAGTWTALDSSSSLSGLSGNYYLSGDITTDATITITSEVNIDLNGYSITKTGYSGVPVFTIKDGTLRIFDGGTAQSHEISDLVNGGTTTISGGLITGGSGSANGGGGVLINYVSVSAPNTGVFELYGGTIAGNKNTNTGDGGGGVCAMYGGTFRMYGGTITGNTASSKGGGVYLSGSESNDLKSFTMYGGTISGNEASYGGGVYVSGSSTFTMEGGTITGNTATSYGDGVYLASGTLKLSGAPVIDANDSDGLCLLTTKYITIGSDGLKSGADIYVTSSAMPEDGGEVQISTNCTADDLAYFSTASGYYMSYNTSSERLFITEGVAPPEDLPDVSDNGGTWQAFPDTTGGDLSSGNYYLTEDVDLTSGALTIANNVTVNLYLNDCVLTGTGAASVISISTGGTLKLHDVTDGTPRYWTDDGTGPWTNPTTAGSGNLTTTGGCITGGSASIGGVSVSGTFYMYGGNIVGNTSSYYGAGVGVYGSFTMYDGTIVGNYHNGDNNGGGGVYLGGTSFTMKGGTIRDNTSNQNGGGVQMSSGVFTMEGGSITGNQSAYVGGAMYMSDGTFNVSGDVNISGNTMTDSSTVSNVYMFNSSTTVNVTGALTNDADIGITRYDNSTTNTLIVDDDNHTLTTSDLEKFTYDKDGYIIYLDDGAGKLAALPDDLPDVGADAVWTPLTSTGGTLAAGNYFLAADTDLDDDLTISSGTVNLYLNDKVLKQTVTGERVITVTSGTLNLYDVETGTEKTVGSTTVTGGVITGGNITGADGAGVNVVTGATFTMHGGNIVGNSSKQYGGGVYVGGTFTMNGGAITGNTAGSFGGGVHISGDGTFTMTDGTIKGNTTTSAPQGDGVYVGGTFNVSGDASVTSNTHNNVYVPEKKTITVTDTLTGSIGVTSASRAGSAVIVDDGSHTLTSSDVAQFTYDSTDCTILFNDDTDKTGVLTTLASPPTDLTTDNLLTADTDLADGGTYYLGYDLTRDITTSASTSITLYLNGQNLTGTVTVESSDSFTVADAGSITIDASALDADDIVVKNGTDTTLDLSDFTITCPDDTYVDLDSDGNIVLVAYPTMIIDGVTTTFQPLTQTTGTLSAGNYFLTQDTTLTVTGLTITSGTVNLYLNDKVLTGTGYRVITVNSGGTLNLYDVDGGTERTWYDDDNDGLWTQVGSGESVGTTTGGVITGGSTSNGGGVYVSGTFTMHGGNIVGNTATAYGGGVFANGTFTMTGGTIKGNTAPDGGGVFVNSGTFAMTGGTITDNTATSGGGVYVKGTFNVSGAPVVTGNTNVDGTTITNVYLYSDTSITVTGELSEDANIGITPFNIANNTIMITDGGEHTLTASDVGEFTLETTTTSCELVYNGTNGVLATVSGAPSGSSLTTDNLLDDTDLADGGTFYLGYDFAGDLTIPAGKTVALYLNGQKLTGTVTLTDKTSVFTVADAVASAITIDTKNLSAGDTVVTKGDTDLNLSNFTLTDSDYYLGKDSSGNLVLKAFADLPSIGVDYSWTAFPSNGVLVDGYYYYMVEDYSGDLTLPASGTVNLALNDYTITDTSGISIDSGVTLVLLGDDGTLTADITVNGGTLQTLKNEGEDDGVEYCYESTINGTVTVTTGTYTMEGGEVTNVIVNGGTFAMSGGTVTSDVEVNGGTCTLKSYADITGSVVLASGQSINVVGTLVNTFTIDATNLTAGDTVVTGETTLDITKFTVKNNAFDLNTNAGSTALYLVAKPTITIDGTWIPLPLANSSYPVTLTTGNYYLTAETDLSNYSIASGQVNLYLNDKTTTNTLTIDAGRMVTIYGTGTVNAITMNGGVLDTDSNATVTSVLVTGSATITDLTASTLTVNDNVTLTVNGAVSVSGALVNNGTVDVSTTGPIGSVTLDDGATVTVGTTIVTVTGTATYGNDNTITVADTDNSLTYGTDSPVTTITAGTVTVSDTGVTATSASVGGYAISGDTFAINNNGTVTLTANKEYTVAGVGFTPAANMTLNTTGADGITITAGTVVHGYTLTNGGKITDTGVTATKATKGSAVFTGDLTITATGITADTADGADFTVKYGNGAVITLVDGVTVGTDATVTAEQIKIGTVTYTADEDDTISISATGVITYPSGTVITYANGTKITLGGEMLSTATNYPANTTVEYGDNEITLKSDDGTIVNGEISATEVKVNGTTIDSSDAVTVTIATGETAIDVTSPGGQATITSATGVQIKLTNGKVSSAGAVSKATSIKVGNTTVTGDAVSATADGTITATTGDEIENSLELFVTVASGEVTITSDKIVMTTGDELSYSPNVGTASTITAVGEVSLDEVRIALPTDAIVTVGTNNPITLNDTGYLSGSSVSSASVTINGVTIATDEGVVSTNSDGETQIFNATDDVVITISKENCATITVDAKKLTKVAANGTITADAATIGGTVVTGTSSTDVSITLGASASVILPNNGTITAGEETYKVSGVTTVTVADTGVVSVPTDTELEKDGRTITAATGNTINADGTMTLTTGATVADDENSVAVTGQATYTTDSKVTVTGANTLTYGTGETVSTITAGTVTVSDTGVTATSATINGQTISGDEFAINNNGTVTLTAGDTYTVAGVEFTVPSGDDITLTATTESIVIATGTVIYGYTLTGGTITQDGLTATKATMGDATFTGNLKVTADGITSTSGTITATYGSGETATVVTLDAGAEVDDEGVVTASEIEIDDVTYTATGIKITAAGVATYPENAVIVDGNYTITLGGEMDSDETNYPANTQVVNGSNTIVLDEEGTIDTTTHELKSTEVTANGTEIVSDDSTKVTVVATTGITTITDDATITTTGDATIDLSDGTVSATGVTTVTATKTATVTVGTVEMDITGGSVDATGAVTDATSIKVSSTTVTGTEVSATADGTITATVDDAITQNGVEVTVASGSVTIVDDKIVMDATSNSLTYDSTIITATGNATMNSDGTINLPIDATTTTGGVEITLKSTGTVDDDGKVIANAVSVSDVTITAEEGQSVTTTAAGVTTSSKDVTISKDGCADVEVAAGDLTSVTGNTVTATELTINGVTIAGSSVSATVSNSEVTIPANGTITVNGETFAVTAETTVTVDATADTIVIPSGTVLEKGDATITVSAETTISNTGVVALPANSTVSNGSETATIDVAGSFTAEDTVVTTQATIIISAGTAQTTITGATDVTITVDNTDVKATTIPAEATITDGTNTLTTGTGDVTVSSDGTITVPTSGIITTQGVEVTMGAEQTVLLSNDTIALPAGSSVTTTTIENAITIEVATGVTGATVNLVTDATQNLVAGTVTAEKVKIGTTELTSTTGNLSVSPEGGTTFPNGGTITTYDEGDTPTDKTVSANSSVTVGSDGTVTYPSTGVSSYSSMLASVQHGTATISSIKNTMNATVTITATPDDGYEVGSVTVTYASGRAVTVTDNGNGTYSYLQPGATVTVTVTFVEEGGISTGEEATGDTSGFTDVNVNAYYYDAMLWAVENGITSGYADDTFRPTVSCNRAQAVTFLWRAAGCPEATMDNPFSDLDEDAYYYDAVLWAVENGITTGYSDGTFRSNTTCNRAAIVTFLWRLAGKPIVNSINLFGDVDAETYYYDAVLWAVGSGITTGYSDGTFAPITLCNRGQIVTFLYRSMAE